MFWDLDFCTLMHLNGLYLTGAHINISLHFLSVRSNTSGSQWVQLHCVWRLHCLISERSQQQLSAHFLTILLCVCVCVRISPCMCVSTWICMSDCSMQFWPLAIQPLLILKRISSPHSSLATIPPTEASTTPYWHPVATGGTTSTWCLADSRGDGELFTSGICP